MKRTLALLTGLAAVGAGLFWAVTRPAALPSEYAGLTGDAARGEVLFAAAGCASCHIGPEAEISDRPVLSGGRRFASPFGTFIAPNISPAPEGVGDWDDSELIHAIRAGVSPEGAHYYPAFPYGSYIRADPQPVADIVAHLRSLPASDAENLPHEVGFPFNIRRSLGGWKFLFLDHNWVIETSDPQIERGRYLVEALGHCGECHTPRNALGGLIRSQWLSGAAAPDGDGTIPNLTSAALTWSEADIAAYLKSGFTPEFDTAGGQMVEVIENTSRLTDDDRSAIAAYLKAVPAIE